MAAMKKQSLCLTFLMVFAASTAAKSFQCNSCSWCSALTGYWPLSQQYGLLDMSGNGNGLNGRWINQSSTGAAWKVWENVTDPLFVNGPSGAASSALQSGPNYGYAEFGYSGSRLDIAANRDSSWTIALYYATNEVSKYAVYYGGTDLHILLPHPNSGKVNPVYVSTTQTDCFVEHCFAVGSFQFVAVTYNASIMEYRVLCNNLNGYCSMTVPPATSSGKLSLAYRPEEGPTTASAACLSVHGKALTLEEAMHAQMTCVSPDYLNAQCPLTTTVTIPTITTSNSPTTSKVSQTTLSSTTKSTTKKTTNLPTTKPPVTSTNPTTKTSTTKATSAMTSEQKRLDPKPSEKIQDLFPAKLAPEQPTKNVRAKKILEYCDDFGSNRRAPPNNGDPTMVTPTFAIDRLMKFDDQNEKMAIFGFILLKWNVTTCNKTDFLRIFGEIPEEPPERVYYTSPDEVWLPKYLFTSSSDGISLDANQEDLLVTVRSNAKSATSNVTLDFYHSRSSLLSAQCAIDLSLFPFDNQTCPFSFAMNLSDENVQFYQPEVVCPDNIGSTEWKFVECNYDTVATIKQNGYYVSYVTFNAVLSRRAVYYVARLVLPNAVAFLLELTTFFLPAEMPERPAFSVTILLALTYGQSSVLVLIPQTSQQVLLVNFVSSLVFASSILTVYHLITCCVMGKRNGCRKVLTREVSCGCKMIRAITLLDFFVLFATVFCFIGLLIYYGNKVL